MNPARAGWRALAVEVTMRRGRETLFQTLLQGEDGLAVDRCLDPRGGVQQLWTTASHRSTLLEWLATLPDALQVRVLRERWLDDEDGSGLDG
ncbi:MAG: DUF4911 domain-containing protein [Mariprofundaceae bacterium]